MSFIEKTNKILLFIAAILVIITIGKSIIKDILRKDYSTPKVQVINEDSQSKEAHKPKIEQRYVGQIKDVHIFEISSDKIIENQSYAADANMIVVLSSLNLSSDAVNLMFVKSKLNNNLLFDSNALIVEFSPTNLKETEYLNSLSKNIYSVARKDTNKDGFLNQNDKKDLLISEYDGSKLSTVLKDIDGYQIINNDSVLVYTTSNGSTLYYIFNVLTGELDKLDTSL